jgi:hypothetical protein
MIVNRRIFIQGALATTTFGALLPSSASQASHASLRPSQAPGSGTDSNEIVFKIDGWDCCDDVATNNQVSIKITQSWRTAWR